MNDTTVALREHFDRIISRIEHAARNCGRDPLQVRLIAASKAQTAQAIRTLAESGQRAFGENYLQEALAKMLSLAGLGLEWHFLGPIQSNKTRDIAERFDWVHSVDRARIAQRLNDQRPAGAPRLQVCIQVNLDREPSKSGVSLEALADLASTVADLPRLKLRGLMAIPSPAQPRAGFVRLRQALEQLRSAGLELDVLSMGMSDDLEAAIEEGATHVRIGTALFGHRLKSPGGA